MALDLGLIYNTALDYQSYRTYIDALVAKGETTGAKQNEKYLEYTKLNIVRMNRNDKTVQLNEQQLLQVAALPSCKLLVIGDAWCGDTGQIIPVIEKIVEASEGRWQMRIISRDSFPELIETYHTNGAKSIPKILFLNEQNEVINTWGPRPASALAILKNWKANQDAMTKEDFEKELHLWYAKDRGQEIISELLALTRVSV
jgi:thioredoxin-like negative regulator of GroEL